ncbi:hypothetical protein FGE12_20165 [Aggregicoccus sp. 17bor-14]|uniref:hypothetical protein n=1 Tax=Myxococcaceae TaxID=31 RepID=UPI00129C6E5E|nr:MULTISPECIES: hypothetical protein [Myxococcaceae]MBF5044726.1 hypothetical protein [Simulacricoccus sp. 17bor-14]MRI90471.1 hypothetical protein [Aggregicoccus sp. 17bor-14]
MRPFAIPLLVLALAGSALTGCHRPRFDTPVDAYRSFHRLVQRGELAQAYDVLSTPTREALARRAHALAEASGGSVKDDPVALFFSNVSRPADVSEVTLAGEQGDAATLHVVSSGAARTVRMVREPSGWRVDLSEVLKP